MRGHALADNVSTHARGASGCASKTGRCRVRVEDARPCAHHYLRALESKTCLALAPQGKLRELQRGGGGVPQAAWRGLQEAGAGQTRDGAQDTGSGRSTPRAHAPDKDSRLLCGSKAPTSASTLPTTSPLSPRALLSTLPSSHDAPNRSSPPASLATNMPSPARAPARPEHCESATAAPSALAICPSLSPL